MASERLTEIESRLMFQEDTLQALNQALIDQQTQIDALKRQVSELLARLRVMQPDSGINDQPEQPPHY